MKITIAIAFALLAIGVNASIDPTYEEIQPFAAGRGIEMVEPFDVATGRQSWIIFINRIRKEIKELIEEYNQCDSYESDALKGTCFTHWSLRLVSDIKQFIEAIKNWNDDELPQARSSTIILINKIRKEIQGLIEEFEQCDSYESDALKGTCFTHWSLRLAGDIKQLVDYIQNESRAAVPQFRGKSDAIIIANNIRKEAKALSDSFNQCQSFRNPVKKGKCFAAWAKVAVQDIFELTKVVLKMATPCKQRGTGLEITKDIVCTILVVTTDVKDLMDLFYECDSQLTDARKGLCFTRFALTILSDAYELIVMIIGFFQPGSPDFFLLDGESRTPFMSYYNEEH